MKRSKEHRDNHTSSRSKSDVNSSTSDGRNDGGINSEQADEDIDDTVDASSSMPAPLSFDDKIDRDFEFSWRQRAHNFDATDTSLGVTLNFAGSKFRVSTTIGDMRNVLKQGECWIKSGALIRYLSAMRVVAEPTISICLFSPHTCG